tara:strand:- start:13407 stop:14216 length:810 start_codon:yes stop_codon:yes gene_type:complete
MSKKVYLRAKQINNHLPKEINASAIRKLSSVYVNRQPLKAFDPEDEKKYLAGMLDVDPSHMEWPKHTKTFWAEFTIPVGFEGVELEVGKTEDGEPIDITDFIKYNFALRHPHVALSEKEMNASSQKRFYIQDLAKKDLQRNNDIQIKKDADKAFIKVSNDENQMRRVFRLLGNIDPKTLTREQVENLLYDIKEKEPKKFIKVSQDKHLELKAEIETMVSAGVLRKIGNQVIFIDEVLGETLDDTVIHLNDKKNSGKLTTLRAKLKTLAS